MDARQRIVLEGDLPSPIVERGQIWLVHRRIGGRFTVAEPIQLLVGETVDEDVTVDHGVLEVFERHVVIRRHD